MFTLNNLFNLCVKAPCVRLFNMNTDTKQTRLIAPTEWWEAVDAWRRSQPNIPSVQESIRRLVLLGIQADTPSARSARRS